jgi:phosphate transport system permease protein
MAQITHYFLKMNPDELQSKLPHLLLLTCVLATAAITIFFIAFIFKTALPVFESQGIGFITGTKWSYSEQVYGIRIFIIGTLAMTGVTLLLAIPVSVFTAIFLSEFAPVRVAGIMRPTIELLVGIPSVVYGIFGLFVLENIFQDHIDPFLSGTLGFIPFFSDTSPNSGTGVLLASTILAVMILPTIIALSEDAMRAVPFEYKEASFALGATHWETIRKVVLPTASGGILAATILGMMRAMGETMAIVMLLGNSAHIPSSVLDTGYAMTSKILNDIGYYCAMDEPRSALFGIAAVLFAMEILFVAAARKIGGNYEQM